MTREHVNIFHFLLVTIFIDFQGKGDNPPISRQGVKYEGSKGYKDEELRLFSTIFLRKAYGYMDM